MRLKFYLVLILTFFFFSSCTREFNNPLDPESLAYTPPSVEIVKPFENETISSTAVTIMWVGNKPEANEYRFRLVDYSDWSEWTTATSASFDYLDDAEYTFEIEVRYKGHTDVRKFSRKFKVDAINGPTLKFYKLKNIVNLGGEFYVSVWVEEVINFKSVQFEVKFDKDKLSLLSVQKGNYVVSRGLDQIVVPDFSLQKVLDEVNNSGKIGISTGVLATSGAGPVSLNGSGEIIKLKFRAKGGGHSYLKFENITMLNSNGDVILINPPDMAYVKVM